MEDRLARNSETVAGRSANQTVNEYDILVELDVQGVVWFAQLGARLGQLPAQVDPAYEGGGLPIRSREDSRW